MGWPPRATTAASVETRVRDERLEKMRAMVLCERVAERGERGKLLMPAFRWAVALLIRVVSSGVVRLDMERRCRGGLGVVAVVAVERGRVWMSRAVVRRADFMLVVLSLSPATTCRV